MSATNKKLKVAIVGYGKMGKIRAACVKDCPDLELVAICEINPQDDLLGIPIYQDYKLLLEYHPDIVFICLPNKYASEAVCYFLNNRVNVFCEKPPGRNRKDVEMVLEAEKAHPGVKLKFGFNHRYHQAVLDAKSIIEKGRLGKILWMRGIYGKAGGNRYENGWRNNREISGGGILIDQGIHMVDLFRFFCGEFDEVKSFINQLYWPVEVEDNAFVLLRNKKRQVAMLHSSATQWAHKFLLDIYLEKGYITITGILSSSRTYGTETLKIARCIYDEEGYPLPNPSETINYYKDDLSWKMEIDEFVYSVINDVPVQGGTCLEAYKTMLLIEKIYDSDKQWMRPESQTL